LRATQSKRESNLGYYERGGMNDMGAVVVWAVIALSFGHAFVAWAFVPVKPSGWDLLVELVRLLRKDL